MCYEEKLINGIWHYRHSSNEKFREFTNTNLHQKISNMNIMLKDIDTKISEIIERLNLSK